MSLSTFDVLDWLSGLLKIHSADPAERGNRAVVLPTALPEREKWVPLIRESLEADDGVLIDATALGGGVSCGEIEDEAPEVVLAIAKLLDSFNTDYPGADLRLEIADGHARVVGAQDYEAANAAQRAVREVATAICADDLRSTSLVAFVYAEDSLDERRVSLIWEVLMQIPELLDLDEAATINIIVGDARVVFDVHCAGNPSLRARLTDWAGLQWRHTWNMSCAPVRQLSRYAATDLPLLVLFLGAGASVADGLPSGDAFRNRVLSKHTGQTVDANSFEKVATDWWHTLAESGQLSDLERSQGLKSFVETLTLEVVLEHEQQVEGQTYSTSLREFAAQHRTVIEALTVDADDPLAKLVALQARIVIVTVNFDRVIEARVPTNQIRTFVTEEDLASFPNYIAQYRVDGGAVPILKLHGDIEVPDTIVANIARTTAGLSAARTSALEALFAELDQCAVRPWWYIGYSMRDRDLDTVWRSPRFYEYQEHWIAPFLDQNVEAFIKSHRSYEWSKRSLPYTPNNRLLSLTASDFFTELAHDLRLN